MRKTTLDRPLADPCVALAERVMVYPDVKPNAPFVESAARYDARWSTRSPSYSLTWDNEKLMLYHFRTQE
jgi:hypothetical protein